MLLQDLLVSRLPGHQVDLPVPLPQLLEITDQPRQGRILVNELQPQAAEPGAEDILGSDRLDHGHFSRRTPTERAWPSSPSSVASLWMWTASAAKASAE